MHKKQIALLMAGLMTVSSLTMGSVTVMADDDPVELYFMFNGPEYTDAYHDLIDHYTEEHPNVSIELEVLQNDYQTVLRSRLNSGEVPDLFLSSAYSDNTLYADYIYNLDDEEFMKNFSETTLTSVTEDGHITGMPFLVQSHGFIYNKALFEQAGITELPTTLDELRTVCEKLTDAGIQPFSSGFGEWWILPQTVYPSMSDAYDGDYDKLFEDVKKGDLIVANKNFGCGSSREHAPLCLKTAGVSCIIAETFARIFYRNAINIGLPIIECPEAAKGIEAGDEVEVDFDNGMIYNRTKGTEFKGQPFPEFMQKLIAAGGLVKYTNSKKAK